jgi:hypothetical protein
MFFKDIVPHEFQDHALSDSVTPTPGISITDGRKLESTIVE